MLMILQVKEATRCFQRIAKLGIYFRVYNVSYRIQI